MHVETERTELATNTKRLAESCWIDIRCRKVTVASVLLRVDVLQV